MIENLLHGSCWLFERGVVSWQSRLQKCVALFITEAVQQLKQGKEMIWMKQFLQDLGLKQDRFVVYFDNKSAIDLSKKLFTICGWSTLIWDTIGYDK